MFGNGVDGMNSDFNLDSVIVTPRSLSKQALEINCVFNDYQIKDYLSEDFFGITYLGVHLETRKKVVIREYFPSELSVREPDGYIVPGEEAVEKENFEWGLAQFEEESRRLMGFEHLNIVEVMDWFTQHGTAYRVTKFQKGQTFKQWLSIMSSLDKPPPSEKKLLAIIIPVLDALKVLHESDYQHRNIRPENIYLCTNGSPLLIDFGASKQEVANKMGNLNLSLPAGYAAKELYSSKGSLSASTDIYAVAATLYFAMTGKKPTAALDRGEARDERALDPLIPLKQAAKKHYRREFLDVVDQGLAYLPKDRPQSASDFKQLLIEQQYKGRQSFMRSKNFASIERMLLIGAGIIFIGSLLLMFVYQKLEDMQEKKLDEQVFSPVATTNIAKKKSQASKTSTKKKTTAPGKKKPPPEKEEAIASKAWTEPYSKMEFIWVPDGSFVIGNNTKTLKKGDKNLEMDGFWMGVYEVTVGQFRQFVDDTGHKTAAGDKCRRRFGWDRMEFEQTENHPVACVSWLDAMAYSEWLNAKTRKKFRLPSEAQWEYACRVGNEKQHYCGGKAPAYIARYQRNSNDKSSVVGTKAKNAAGLYDMSGNVWEWTGSEYLSKYKGQEQRSLRANQVKGTNKRMVFRGGSWMYDERYLTSVYRGYSKGGPNLSYDDVGFRLVIANIEK